MNWTKWDAGTVVAIMLCLVFLNGIALLALAPGEEKAPLADRITTVCKKGYYAADWSMGSSWYGTPQPDGVVRVVCASVKDRYDIYNVAVEE